MKKKDSTYKMYLDDLLLAMSRKKHTYPAY
jgi:hypothetical protein